MAEIAMLMVALGGLYVISNHDNEPRELAGFENMGEASNALPSINPPNLLSITQPITNGSVILTQTNITIPIKPQTSSLLHLPYIKRLNEIIQRSL